MLISALVPDKKKNKSISKPFTPLVYELSLCEAHILSFHHTGSHDSVYFTGPPSLKLVSDLNQSDQERTAVTKLPLKY